MNKCNDCRRYEPKKEPYSMGRCLFPLPEWLLTSCCGGGWVDNMLDRECIVFLSYEADDTKKKAVANDR